VGLGVAWIAGAVALQTPGLEKLRRDIQRSSILSTLNETLPSRSVLNALARFDPIPSVAGPEATVPPPTSRIARDPDVRGVSSSVVKVLGTACGLGVEGSGWVGRGDGVVVTNAHVVAGQNDTTVQLGGLGPSYDATLIWFDDRNDLALLRVPGVAAEARALKLDPSEKPGTPAAILGFPENGPYHVEPGRLGPTREVLSDDAYGHGPVPRLITSVRGRVRSGNSGGPVVDGEGEVVGTIFASTLSSGGRSGLAVPDSIVADALRKAAAPVANGPCTR
jgi:S1-C subfamily serine protease